jgi:two-component system sensor histidine kinase HydH
MVFLAAIAGLLIVTAAVVTARLGLRAQRQREETARRLHLASLGELAATVAHEIRNPLGAIRGYAQLAEEAAGGDAARRAATTIREECARIDRTVDEVLGYARQSLPRRETFDLRAAADEALERRAIAAADRDVRLVRDYGDARVEVSADRDQVIRLLGNLVDNALAASPSGGQVTVRLSGGRREAAIGVEDEGPGVPAGDRDRVFEPFFTRRAGGTGLGLALVRRIAEAHGGTVALRDGTRGGALFEVRLPRG